MSKTMGVALGLSVVAVVFAAGQGRSLFQARQEAPRLVPAPAVDAVRSSAEVDVGVLAGGCFWGVQGVYQHTNGVISSVSGYAGGEKRTAAYDLVGMGTTGRRRCRGTARIHPALDCGRTIRPWPGPSFGDPRRRLTDSAPAALPPRMPGRATEPGSVRPATHACQPVPRSQGPRRARRTAGRSSAGSANHAVSGKRLSPKATAGTP